jgi:hypothetical protein
MWLNTLFQLIPALSTFSDGLAQCPTALKFGTGPPTYCQRLTDPNNKPQSPIESWFTREMFNVGGFEKKFIWEKKFRFIFLWSRL